MQGECHQVVVERVGQTGALILPADDDSIDVDEVIGPGVEVAVVRAVVVDARTEGEQERRDPGAVFAHAVIGGALVQLSKRVTIEPAREVLPLRVQA